MTGGADMNAIIERAKASLCATPRHMPGGLRRKKAPPAPPETSVQRLARSLEALSAPPPPPAPTPPPASRSLRRAGTMSKQANQSMRKREPTSPPRSPRQAADSGDYTAGDAGAAAGDGTAGDAPDRGSAPSPFQLGGGHGSIDGETHSRLGRAGHRRKNRSILPPGLLAVAEEWGEGTGTGGRRASLTSTFGVPPMATLKTAMPRRAGVLSPRR